MEKDERWVNDLLILSVELFDFSRLGVTVRLEFFDSLQIGVDLAFQGDEISSGNDIVVIRFHVCHFRQG